MGIKILAWISDSLGVPDVMIHMNVWKLLKLVIHTYIVRFSNPKNKIELMVCSFQPSNLIPDQT